MNLHKPLDQCDLDECGSIELDLLKRSTLTDKQRAFLTRVQARIASLAHAATQVPADPGEPVPPPAHLRFAGFKARHDSDPWKTGVDRLKARRDAGEHMSAAQREWTARFDLMRPNG